MHARSHQGQKPLYGTSLVDLQLSSSGSTSPAISLGNDNEDDCFGILPSITRR
jgi:hypothetical protein